MSEVDLIRGLKGLLAHLKAKATESKLRGEPPPAVMYLAPQAYDLFIEAMDGVNLRIGVPAPLDRLYTYKGTKIRRYHNGK